APPDDEILDIDCVDDLDSIPEWESPVFASASYRDWGRNPWDPQSWFRGESTDEKIRRLERELERELERFGIAPRDIWRRERRTTSPGAGRPTHHLENDPFGPPRSNFWSRYYREKGERIERARADPDVMRAAEELYRWYRRLGRYRPRQPLTSVERAVARLTG